MSKPNKFGLRTYKGPYEPFKACDLNCAESFKEDRQHDLFYGSFLEEDGSPCTWEKASIDCDFCAYCGPAPFTGNMTIHS